MDLDFSEEQQVLRDMVRGLCQEYASPEVVRAMEDDPTGYTSDFWKQLGELGLLGILIPESYGGSQQSMLECAIVYEEFGRSLAPSPHFASSILCTSALLAAGSEEQKSEWLPKIASGDAILTPAWLERKHGYGPRGVALSAALSGSDYRLNGSKWLVPFASSATRLLVPVRTGSDDEDIDLLLVDPRSPGVELSQQLSLASETQYEIRFRDVTVPASQRIGAAGSGWQTWNRVMHDAIILLAAQAMGGADRALEMTVEYAKERKQFDKPLGAFQAISHYLADAVTLVDGGRSLVHNAAWAHAEGKPIDRLAPMAKLFACQTYRDVTAMAEQVYGGVGFTVEYDIQLYFRRAKQLQLSWWDTRYLEELVAKTVLDRESA